MPGWPWVGVVLPSWNMLVPVSGSMPPVASRDAFFFRSSSSAARRSSSCQRQEMEMGL